MRFTNVSRCQAGWTAGYERDGRELLIVIVKATYSLPARGEEPEPAQEHVPLVEADEFTGDPGTSAPTYETDYAHRKPFCDVLLLGKAHAPGEASAARVAVGLKVGAMEKQFAVVGPRVWRKGALGVSASSPQPFSALPISYDTAYGGTDRTVEASKGQVHTYLANPVGRGYWHSVDALEGQPLPSTESLDRPVTSPSGQYVPMSFSPIGRNWSPRVSHAGTYDQEWVDNDAPFWPKDFDYRYFQSAPPDQQIPYPTGGEVVRLRNLTADGQRLFHLPARRMPVTFIPHRGRDVTQDAVIDTIVIEPEHERFTLTWRSSLALGKSLFDVKETIAGEMPAGWHRARRSPGKTYYPGLAALVAARRGEAE